MPVPIVAERVALASLLGALAARKGWNSLQSDSLIQLQDQVQNTVRPRTIGRHELQRKLHSNPPQDFRTFQNLQFVLLEPPQGQGDILPAFAVDCTNGWQNFRIYLVLFTSHEGSLIALGFRFESPESPGGSSKGDHNFYHLQLMDNGSHRRIPFPEWIPAHQPSIPLNAENWMGLVLCMLISVYGARAANSILLEESFPGLNNYARQIDALN